MDLSASLFTLAAVAFGATVTFATTALTERGRFRRSTSDKWIERRLDAYATFVADAKAMRFTAQRVAAGLGLDDDAQVMTTDEGAPLLAEADAVRSRSYELVALIGSPGTVEAARVLNRAVWRLERAARSLAPCTRPEWQEHLVRYMGAIDGFNRTARQDLHVPGQYVDRQMESLDTL